MAIFHLSVKTVSRGKGQSAIAKAAYNTRDQLRDEQTGKLKDYSRTDGLMFSGIFAPKDAPEWAQNREALWNAVEQREKRKDAQLAREIQLGLPCELTDEQRKQLVTDFVREQFMRKGMIADVAIHEASKTGDQRNYHAHVLLTMREIGPDGFGPKVREWNSTAQLEQWREAWERTQNRYLERHGYDTRVDRRTLEAQGIDRPATQHRGPNVDGIERRLGIQTERGNIYRDTNGGRADDLAVLRAELSAIEKQIAAEQVREQPTEWERREALLASLTARAETWREFRQAGHEIAERITAPDDLNRTAARIWEACQRSDNPRSFAAALEDSGLLIARATKEEARASEIDSHHAKQQGKFAPVYREGEVLIVDELANVYRLTPRVTGDEWRDIRKFMATLDPKGVHSIEATKQIMQDRAEAFEIDRQAFRALSSVGALKRGEGISTGQLKWAAHQVTRDVMDTVAGAGVAAKLTTETVSKGTKAVSKPLEKLANLAAGAIEFLGNMFGATAQTPERIQARVEASEKAAANAEIDRERYRTDKAYREFIQLREAQKLELDEERQRDYRQRERDGPQR